VFEPGRFEIFEETLAATFAAVPRFPITAETASGVEKIGAVDPDHAGFDLRSGLQGDVHAFAPDRSGEAVNRIVGELHGFLRRAKSHGGKNRAENFLLGDNGSGMNVAEQRGLVIKAA